MVWLKTNIRTLLILIPVFLIILVLVNPLNFSANNPVPTPLPANADIQPPNMQEEDASLPAPVLSLVVDVKGAVHSPGVYEMKEGDRVTDVLKLAGGETQEADMKAVNLSQRLQDEMVIYVPSAGEDMPAVTSSTGSEAGEAGQSQKININTADASVLENIPGVGPAKAQAIMVYRETEGDFKTIEEIKNISGIGDKTFDKMKESIDVK
ncbi:helix-hairpin-helix domain-containing protein [Jeotgalibacillus campisalis]|uniref:Competence protein ComEA n=1 Tax=Jeotgalibacillus campisalis TaxID=220754 RepID=A0A0C2VPY4_9BACL|nr:helix-hairpin-helix domain-containing protein [Jeotgalibacillus campisalis]KIL46063.1 competence protein ComEA [Jeotgalibacillus campisalis]